MPNLSDVKTDSSKKHLNYKSVKVQTETIKKLNADSDKFPDHSDAVIAAPNSHQVLLENEKVRVLRVVIESGAKEPFHTHKSGSVMIVDQPAQIKYYGQDGNLVFMTQPTDGKTCQKPQWLEPEGMHSVENIDNKVYKAYRIEIKE